MKSLATFGKNQLKRFPPGDVVAKEWRLGVEGMAPMGGGHGAQALVRLEGGRAVVLKRLRRESLNKNPDAAEAILGAVAAVAQAEGVDVAAPLARRGDRDFLLEWDGKLFYLMRFVDGARPSFRRVEDVAAVMGALGRLHRAGARLADAARRTAGGQTPGASGPTTDLGVMFQRTLDARYENWVGVIMGPAAGLGMRLAVRGAARAVALIEEARTLAPQAGTTGARGPAGLCHGDTHENNFLILEARVAGSGAAKNGGAGAGSEALHRAAHLDVESFEWDALAADLVVPLHYLGYFSRWNADALRRALAAYERERPLEEPERKYIAAQLMLPRHWQRAMKSILKKGAMWRDMSAWVKRGQSLRDLDRQRECVKGLWVK